MNAPRDHHFIPAFYLKEWEGPNGQVIEYQLIENAQVGRKLVEKMIGRDSTGFERDLYAFPELPPNATQFVEQEFFAYADQKASNALDNHLGIAAHPWTSELVSAWPASSSPSTRAIPMRCPSRGSRRNRFGMQAAWTIKHATKRSGSRDIHRPLMTILRSVIVSRRSRCT